MLKIKKITLYSSSGRCPYGWSLINGKCLFVSTFTLNWTDAFAYCKSFTAQLLTLLPVKLHPNLTLSHLANLVASNSNYFIGLSEQPNDSGSLACLIEWLILFIYFRLLAMGRW